MSVLILSGHDYRSARRAHMHFIADELAKRMATRFVSIGFSVASWFREDARLPLWGRANRVETVNGVECYLWRTLVHPFNLRVSLGEALSRGFFDHYTDHTPEVIWQWAKDARIIIFESGLSPIFIKKIRALNPGARLIYLAADHLATIGCSDNVAAHFARAARDLDAIVAPSPVLARHMPPGVPFHYVPHGLDPSIAEFVGSSPYGPGRHGVSVGSMLFDPEFFVVAAAARPDVTFHVIGAGRSANRLKRHNIVVYPEMPFRQTIPYIAHAGFGIAAYEGRHVAPYLEDTSLKLMQYQFFGLPAVCPDITAGGQTGRYGYNPFDPGSIATAIASALNGPRPAPAHFIPWAEVVDRILAIAEAVPKHRTDKPSSFAASPEQKIG